jgi:hypothetical protein
MLLVRRFFVIALRMSMAQVGLHYSRACHKNQTQTLSRRKLESYGATAQGY